MGDTDTYAARRAALFESLPDAVETVVLAPGPSLRYFTGYTFDRMAHGSDSPCVYVLSRDLDAVMLVPALERERAASIVGDATALYTYDDHGVAAGAFSDLREAIDLGGAVGVEPRSMRLLEYDLLADTVDPTAVVDITESIDDLRARKDGDEIEALRRAGTIITDILDETLPEIHPGMTETDVHAAIRKRVLDSDADSYAVGIVTSGERTARNYTDTTDREIEPGDPVMIDTGVVYDGYYSDVTRTIVVGPDDDVDPDIREMHAAVREAAAAARDAARPGVTAGDLDGVARESLTEAGYGDAFVTDLGHGIGLEAHEQPYLSADNDRVIAVGNAFTVEPGAYIPGTGGVRIEDDLVVTEDDPIVLTEFDRGLRPG